MNIKTKICCISSIEEALMAIEFGADAIGLVGSMPSGPGVISDTLIAEISGLVPDDIDTFLLTSETDARSVIDHHSRANTTTIQIVDKIVSGTHHEIRAALPRVKIVQVVHVIDDSSIETALEAAVSADIILLDSGNPNLATKELGGTGRTHNWAISRRIVEQSAKPVFLAGGLNPENVREAVEMVQPFGVDLCSGVRTNGMLDREKLGRFFEELNFD